MRLGIAIIALSCSIAAGQAMATPRKATAKQSPAPVAPAIKAANITFQNFSIGDTIDQVKATKLPDGKYGRRWMACTDSDEGRRAVTQLPSEVKAGILECLALEKIASSIVRSDFNVSADVVARVSLYIFEGRLARIECTYSAYNLQALKDSLRVKFGPPSSSEADTVHNGYGATFDRITEKWKFANGEIDLQSPFGQRDTMLVLYDGSAAIAMDKAQQKARANLDL